MKIDINPRSSARSLRFPHSARENAICLLYRFFLDNVLLLLAINIQNEAMKQNLLLSRASRKLYIYLILNIGRTNVQRDIKKKMDLLS